MAEKPMGVMPLCIIAIALGVMGFFGGGFSLAMLLLNPKTDPAVTNDQKLEELNAEFQRRVQATTKETRPFLLLLTPAMMATSLLLAGAGLAGTKLRGRGLLQLAFGASLLVDGIGAIYGMIAQAKMMDVTKWYFKEIAATSKSLPGMDTIMQVSMYSGLFFGLGWLVVKTAFYLWGLIYFGRRNVREAFEGAAA